MSENHSLSDHELDQVAEAIRSGSLRDDPRLADWVRRMLAELRSARGSADAAAPTPSKAHGDALLEGNGSRHGPDPAGG
jgi:hypothetical protein